MKFKTDKEQLDLEQVDRERPDLLAVLSYMDQVAQIRFGVQITITSIYRSGHPLHGVWRAADVRIYNQNRDGSSPELRHDEAMELLDATNTIFAYGTKGDGKLSQCVHYVHNPADPQQDHLHVQVTGPATWTAR